MTTGDDASVRSVRTLHRAEGARTRIEERWEGGAITTRNFRTVRRQPRWLVRTVEVAA